MRKIANPTELQSEITCLIDYAQSSRPSRERIAQNLRQLSERLVAPMPKRAAGMDARAMTDLLFRMKNKEIHTAHQALMACWNKMNHLPSPPELEPEQTEAWDALVKSNNEFHEFEDALERLFAKMGWR